MNMPWGQLMISVDVETDGTDPFRNNLLSVGMVAFKRSGLLDEFYANLLPSYGRVSDQKTMLDFWANHPDRFNETRRFEHGDKVYERETRADARSLISHWINSVYRRHAPGVSPVRPTFVAWPVSFDKPWIDDLLSTRHSPFHYSGFCIGSFVQGVYPFVGSGRHESPRNMMDELVGRVPNDGPHNALFDARQQAEQCRRLMNIVEDARRYVTANSAG